VAPPPTYAVVPPPAASASAPAELSDVLEKLQTVGDLPALSPDQRTSLLDSLIRALTVVNSECAAPGQPSVAQSPVAAVPVAPPPQPVAAPPPQPVAAPPPQPVATSASGVQSSSSYDSLMSGNSPATPPPVARAAPPPAPRAAGPATADSSVNMGSSYYVEGMDQMTPDQYRKALKNKLDRIQAARVAELGQQNTGSSASNTYMQQLEDRSS